MPRGSYRQTDSHTATQTDTDRQTQTHTQTHTDRHKHDDDDDGGGDDDGRGGGGGGTGGVVGGGAAGLREIEGCPPCHTPTPTAYRLKIEDLCTDWSADYVKLASL